MTTFRQAIDARDLDAVDDMLADDVVFRSPVAFAPYQGKAIVSAILRTVLQVFEGFHYIREIHDVHGRDHAFVFEATVNGLTVTGCDFLRYGDEGRIVDFMVMVRPLRAAEALSAAMGSRFEQIKADAAERSAR